MKQIIKKSFILFLILSLISCSVNALPENITVAKGPITYHGIASGYNGPIELDLTLENDYIKEIVITKQSETLGIGAPLLNKEGKNFSKGGISPVTLIPKMVVDNQSINIDAVSGATATSYGILHAVSDALMKAGYKLDAVSSATEKSSNERKLADVELTKEEKTLLDKWLIKVNHKTIHDDQICDVAIIGGGGAGLAAAISASENGAKVIVIEKNGEVGGDTLVCGAIYNAPNEELQKNISMTKIKEEVIGKALNDTPVNDDHKNLINEVKNQLEEYKKSGREDLFDSKEWFALQTFNGGDKKANLNLVKALCYNSYDGLNWIKNIGVEFFDFISQGAGSLWERTHTNIAPMGTGFISNYLETIENDENITILTNTTALSVNQNESGMVDSVLCMDKYGNEFKVNVNKSVVIATGGFSANKQMLDLYNVKGESKWEDIDLKSLPTTNRKTVSNGSGIELASKVESDTVDMSEIQLLYLGNPINGELTKYPPRCVNGTDQVIFINKNGERFTNEGGRRDDICMAILNEPDKIFYILESGDGDKYVDIYSSEFKSADGFSLDYLEQNGYICVGKTLEELAEKLEIDASALQKTIDEFNECVDGKEDKFGRTLFSTKLENGPFVATKRQVSVHHTMGGIKIDENCRVLDKEGNIIQGLYAAGEVTGGIHGGNRLGGNAVVDTVVFGKKAGESAALNN